MSNAISLFTEFYEKFKKDPLWFDMLNTCENSPWHREENVAEHTRMLIRFYFENFSSKRNEVQQMYSLIACLFHDVGKPKAEIHKFSEDRGNYKAYHGHESISARLWVDYALKHQDEIGKLRLNINDVSNIAFMIEHHLPFDIEKPAKIKALKLGIIRRCGSNGHRAWIDQLICDQHGRISDDQNQKLVRFENWLSKWDNIHVSGME